MIVFCTAPSRGSDGVLIFDFTDVGKFLLPFVACSLFSTQRLRREYLGKIKGLLIRFVGLGCGCLLCKHFFKCIF